MIYGFIQLLSWMFAIGMLDVFNQLHTSHYRYQIRGLCVFLRWFNIWMNCSMVQFICRKNRWWLLWEKFKASCWWPVALLYVDCWQNTIIFPVLLDYGNPLGVNFSCKQVLQKQLTDHILGRVPGVLSQYPSGLSFCQQWLLDIENLTFPKSSSRQVYFFCYEWFITDDHVDVALHCLGVVVEVLLLPLVCDLDWQTRCPFINVFWCGNKMYKANKLFGPDLLAVFCFMKHDCIENTSGSCSYVWFSSTSICK